MCRVRTGGIVVRTPVFQHMARVAQAFEQCLIQAFISHAPVEALHEGVLRGHAGCNVMPAHSAAFRPLEDRHTGELCPVTPLE